ncbi:MAG TPA: SPOR domain-containing protein [Rhodanobacteraceae bacterium]|jgi:hypothetical protein|nr:SPOR domain-containing protein [Rhodanobacteraceae bacterium]
MFIRLVFLLLFALNLGAAAWLLFGHPPAQPLPPVTDPGVPALQLLTEHPHPAIPPDATPATGSTSTRVLRDVCHTLGPFTTDVDMRAAMQSLSPHVARIQYHQESVSRSRGFWVYLPAAASREAALNEARQLEAKGIHEYYVVTAGDQQNMISLGLFSDEANAQKRLAELKQAGFAAEAKQRIDTEPAYWVDFAVPPGSTFAWTAWLPGRSDLIAKPIDCF